MTRSIVATAVAGVLTVTILLGAAIAQGNGNGPGNGAGRGPGHGACMGAGPGGGMGYGAGGWWNRVTPKTPQQQEFVAQVTALHAQIRQANWDLIALQRQNAPADQVAATQRQVAELRARLQELMRSNQRLLQEMGLPAGAGVCDGTGAKGPGFRQGNGMGRGAGRGPRDGTGPNPTCPLKAR